VCIRVYVMYVLYICINAYLMIRFKHTQHMWVQAALTHEFRILMLQHHDVQGPGRPFQLHDASAEL
jgi:hypothetical protein